MDVGGLGLRSHTRYRHAGILQQRMNESVVGLRRRGQQMFIHVGDRRIFKAFYHI